MFCPIWTGAVSLDPRRIRASVVPRTANKLGLRGPHFDRRRKGAGSIACAPTEIDSHPLFHNETHKQFLQVLEKALESFDRTRPPPRCSTEASLPDSRRRKNAVECLPGSSFEGKCGLFPWRGRRDFVRSATH